MYYKKYTNLQPSAVLLNLLNEFREVKFENDRAIYTYELMVDYRRGDVLILV